MNYLVGLLLMCSAPVALAGELPTKEMVVSVNDVYIPGGFSSDSDAYVVVNGVFPNSCYRYDRAEVRHTSPLLHEVASVAKVTQGMCLMVMVPWTKEVRLGRLDRGNHTLRFRNGDGTFFERNLEIE